jgi:hypothetical protein
MKAMEADARDEEERAVKARASFDLPSPLAP